VKGPCPDPEQLFVDLATGAPAAREHLEACADCAALVELHRQLEKDLHRLSDPLPPPDFVHQVMARVQAQPVAPARELLAFGGILAATLAALLALVLFDSATAGAWGTRVASWAVGGRDLAEAAALPVTVAAVMILAMMLVAARRLLAPPASRVRT
jgi:anti-sigma factor RsiW